MNHTAEYNVVLCVGVIHRKISEDRPNVTREMSNYEKMRREKQQNDAACEDGREVFCVRKFERKFYPL